VSLLDVLPTVLDWFGLPVKQCGPEEHSCPSGRSMLPVLDTESVSGWNEVFASQSLHEITMYYPMRAVRTRRYRLVHNMAYRAPFPIDQDFYASPSFQDLLERTRDGRPLDWFVADLLRYYYRPAWELYDLAADPRELRNLADEPASSGVLRTLKGHLLAWQNATADPWLCGLSRVRVRVRGQPDRCGPTYNGLDDE